MTVDAARFDVWAQGALDRVETALERWVPEDSPAGLGEAMRYAVLGGGKRLRPLLVLAACEATGGCNEAALRAACSVELIHAYSLVHDDMPCMDDDVMRRGKPTVHVAFGEAQAMLAGDAMQALAFEVLTPEEGVEPALQARLCALLARSAGNYAQLVGKDAGYAQIKLSSGELRLVPGECLATVGAVSNPDNQNIVIAKAGRARWLGIRPVVRGVAMNPVDHPHGGGEGRTSGGRHPVTPWGKPTKGKKTRKNKATDKYIIRRRHATR